MNSQCPKQYADTHKMAILRKIVVLHLMNFGISIFCKQPYQSTQINWGVTKNSEVYHKGPNISGLNISVKS